MFKKTIIFYLVLMALSGVIAIGKEAQTKLSLPDGSLTAKIRNLNDGKIEFILKAGKEDISFYQEWNSWGWFVRSFVAHDKNRPKTKYLIHRRSKDWNRNYPSLDKIKAGHVFVTVIDICDGTWIVKPELKKGKAHTLLLQGCFDIPEEKQGKLFSKEEKKVHKNIMEVFGRSWAGHLETNVIELLIPKECISNLNYSGFFSLLNCIFDKNQPSYLWVPESRI